MHRKSLLLIAVCLTLATAFFLQMSAVQAVAPQQETPVTAEPLPQPLRIQFRQQIPITIDLPSTLFAMAVEAVATPVTATQTLTEAAAALEAAALQAATQVTATGTTTVTEAEAAEAATVTNTMALSMTSIMAVLEISFDLVVSDTLTTTVPASVTLRLSDAETVTLPVSLTVAALPDGTLVIEPQVVEEPTPTATPTTEPTATLEPTATPEASATPEVAATAAVTGTQATTPTGDIGPTAPLTTTAPVAGGARIVQTLEGVTANLRTGPGTAFDLAGEAAAGEALPLIAISEDGLWYLLADGAWIAGFLLQEQPTDLPIATQELIDRLSGVTATVTPTTTVIVTDTTTVTNTATVTNTETVTNATPITETVVTIDASPAVTPSTVTVDANLRAGPGLEFAVLGGTITGQTIVIVGRNADGTWYRLDNTGWVAAQLVLNAPPLDSIPVLNADGTPVTPAVVPAPEPTAPPASPGGFFPTPTPQP